MHYIVSWQFGDQRKLLYYFGYVIDMAFRSHKKQMFSLVVCPLDYKKLLI